MSAATIREDILNLPNLLTLLRIALIPVASLFIYYGDPMSGLIAVILFAVASITDWLDGYLARRQDLVSMTGKFLDPLADKLLVMASLLMLLPLGRISPWLVLIILAREFAVMGLRSIAAGEGFIIAAGQWGKFKTAFQMVGIIGLIIHYEYVVDYGFIETRVDFHTMGLWLVIISIAFSLISAYEYFRGFLKAIDRKADTQPPSPS
ncbi:MAG: CDP-diacylglycerol--glycerol-3-phosphate 3-phosphatidyltransferase [Persicimonas sp.]